MVLAAFQMLSLSMLSLFWARGAETSPCAWRVSAAGRPCWSILEAYVEWQVDSVMYGCGTRDGRRELGGTRGPGSPRIAPGRNRASLQAEQCQPQKASTLTLNAAATRGTAAATPLRREEKWHGPYRGGTGMWITGGDGYRALHIQPKLPNHQASSQQLLEKFIQG